MTSPAQRDAAKLMAARIVAMAEERPDDDFGTNAAEIIAGTSITPRVADRVLDQSKTLLNPLLGPHGLRVTKLGRVKRTRERIDFNG